MMKDEPLLRVSGQDEMAGRASVWGTVTAGLGPIGQRLVDRIASTDSRRVHAVPQLIERGHLRRSR
jgi:hypothetical protein